MKKIILIEYSLLGDKMLKIGDIVTRKKYNNDILFKIVNIDNEKVILRGIDVRLYADSYLDDLVLSSIRKKEEDEEEIRIDKKKDEKYFYIPGVILHLDADIEYFKKCEEYYKKQKVSYFGYVFNENEFIEKIDQLIQKHNPDIIVLTGHDAYYKNKKYKNSTYFIQTVKNIRKKYGNEIIIISGACQSDYYNLMKNGSTYASSPSHINIHALDPAIIAAHLALVSKNQTIDIINLLNKTKYGADGIGGIETKGKMKIGYPKIKNE